MGLILNITSGLIEVAGETFIHERHRPSFVHYSEESAENEIIRLKNVAPDQHFVIFEAVSEIKDYSVILERIKKEC